MQGTITLNVLLIFILLKKFRMYGYLSTIGTAIKFAIYFKAKLIFVLNK